MPINMNCPSCGKTLAAPETAAGKKAKCPSCGQIMIVPEATQAAEDSYATEPESAAESPASYGPQSGPDSSPSWLDGVQSPAPAPAASGPGGEARRPCRECGEMIVAAAAKCRFCGAVFDPRLRGMGMGMGMSTHRGKSYQGFAITSMVLGILSIFTACIGIVLGITGVIFGVVAGNGMKQSKNFEGKGMATAGIVMGLLGSIGWTLIYVCIFMAVAARGPGHF